MYCVNCKPYKARYMALVARWGWLHY